MEYLRSIAQKEAPDPIGAAAATAAAANASQQPPQATDTPLSHRGRFWNQARVSTASAGTTATGTSTPVATGTAAAVPHHH